MTLCVEARIILPINADDFFRGMKYTISVILRVLNERKFSKVLIMIKICKNYTKIVNNFI